MTVLDQPATNARDRAVRWRQLVDLVARAGGQATTPLVQRAIDIIRADRQQVDEALRAAAARAIAALPLPPALIALFASDRLAVSAPVLAAAKPENAEWPQILANATEETRNFVASLRPELFADHGPGRGDPRPERRDERRDERREVRPQPPAAKPLPVEPKAVEPKASEPKASEPKAVEPAAPAARAPKPPARKPPTPEPPAAQPPSAQAPSGEPAVAPPANAAPQPSAQRPPFSPSISEVVERLEQLRQAVPRPTPASPTASGTALFRWECNPSGDIAWVEGAPRGPLVGRSIARADEGEGVGDEVERAFAMRAPFRDAAFILAGEGAVAGHWKISGFPAFEPTDGRFRGYRGIALRDGANGHAIAPGAPSRLSGPLSDPNSLRELVHEIKTPLNAIIGFAEIIDGQYLGPANRRYRTRAAEIVAQARLLLSAIDDLDFAAKLQADRDRPGSGTDLAMLLEQIATAMRQGASGDAPRLDIVVDTTRRRCALEPALAERLITRFCTALLGSAADREAVQLHLDSTPGKCLLWAHRPRQLTAGKSHISDPSFSLRLVGGLARIAGGELKTDGRVTLALPEL
jgi:hypothetical protein